MHLRNGKMVSKNIVMIFDTETTGLGMKDKEVRGVKTALQSKSYYYKKPIESEPYITQLCYILFDLHANQILTQFCHYIQLPEGIEISERATEITGITKDKCMSEGISLEDAMISFYRDLHKANILVAHNYAFDKNVITVSMKRCFHSNMFRNKCPFADISLSSKYLLSCSIEHYCTMKHSTELCKIFHQGRTTGAYKWPKLAELHQHLFGEVPENLHDALIDVKACLRCYLYMNTSPTTGIISIQ
jgi:DNA polymerase III epsilon subunit-like protein